MTSGARSFALLVLFPLAALAQGWDLGTLMQDMAKVESSRARFVETRHIALLTQPLELKGSLSYERPHRLAKHVQSPVDELLSVDGEALTLLNRTKGEQRVFSLRDQPAAGALVASVRATLAGDIAELQRHYKPELSGARSAWRLRLTPRNPQIARHVEEIVLSGAHARIERIETLEKSGDRSTMTIVHDAR